MKVTPCHGFGALLCTAALTLACASSPSPRAASALAASLVIHDANVITLQETGPDGSPIRAEPGRTIVIRGDRIVWLGPASDAPRVVGAETIDASGKFVIPGLSDMHAHLPTPGTDDEGAFEMERYLELQIVAGVTTVRSMRGHPSHAGLREAIERGEVVGPDLYLASSPVAATSLTEEEVEAIVAQAKTDGADFIKLLGLDDATSYRRLMAGAQAGGLTVAGHLPPSIEPALALELGQRSFEHLHGVLDAARASEQAGRDAASSLAVPELFHCPTLHWAALQRGAYAAAAFKGDAALRDVDASRRHEWDDAITERRRLATADPPKGPRDPSVIRDRLVAVRLLHEAGAQLLIGPDAEGAYGLPGSSVHEEMRLFADAGLPPADILRAATVHAARLRGAPDEGTIATGNVANLVLLAEDPLVSIDNVRSVTGTVHRGRWRPRPSTIQSTVSSPRNR